MRAFLTSRGGSDWALYFHLSCAGFSLWHRLSLVVARGGFSCCRAWTLVVAHRVRCMQARELPHLGSFAPWHVASRFPDQDQTCMPCFVRLILFFFFLRLILYHWTTREVPWLGFLDSQVLTWSLKDWLL